MNMGLYIILAMTPGHMTLGPRKNPWRKVAFLFRMSVVGIVDFTWAWLYDFRTLIAATFKVSTCSQLKGEGFYKSFNKNVKKK